MENDTTTPQNTGDRSFRLDFSYEDSILELISAKRVRAIHLPSDPLPHNEKGVGFWFELRNKEDEIIYQKVIHNPIGLCLEVSTSEYGRKIRNEIIESPNGTFRSLMPDLLEAQAVEIFSSLNKHETEHLPSQGGSTHFLFEEVES